VKGHFETDAEGIARQSQTHGHYTYGNSDPENLWNTIYAGPVIDLKVLGYNV